MIHTVCSTFFPKLRKALIALRLSYLMYGVFALVAALTAAILCYFPSKPKLPPSKSSAVERMEFLPGLRAMCW